MPLSWNEIKTRATVFANEWKDEVSEDAEAKSFWDDFFNVFGISRRRVASFEQQVSLTPGSSSHGEGRKRSGFIDLLWKGMILIEHKSRGKDLTKAYQQAKDYFPGLKEKELPRYILVSDFERFNLYDLETNESYQFALTEFVQHVHLFGFIAGYEKRVYKEQDPVNIEAAALMGKLHDKLKAIGYEGHALELYLVRLLFCLFADDTNIFEKGILHDYIDLRTNEDGSDLAAHIGQLFDVLNTPRDKRFKNLDENLAAFPYVNGKLFEERLPTASFDSDMRKTLLDCCLLDWGKISPAIFGSMFQSVMNPKERRNLGAHYTSEKNIMKLIKPLFLDDLWKEYEQVKDSKPKLQKLHEKISRMRFLDPACGCGNFLIIAYRELRLLEMEIVKTLLKGQTVTDISYYFLLDVDQFYGIEYEEFPAQIAQVAMWLIDHQMNMKASETFGEYYVRLPLRKSATIRHGNALRIDWQSLIEPMPWEKGEAKFDFIFGNPPFIGSRIMNKNQKQDLINVFDFAQNIGDLDYVTAWYITAAKYIQKSKIKVAFVSTNSIVQGLQTTILWRHMLNRYCIKIHFAHRTFKWSNEAKGNAAVYCVIIGFANYDSTQKKLFEYEDIKGEPHELIVNNINPYLLSGNDILIDRQQNPICNVPKMHFGNMPADGGELLFTTEEKNNFLEKEPNAINYLRKFVGSHEFINKIDRWCLWLQDINPTELKKLKFVVERVERVRKIREQSSRPQLASIPHLFAQITQPKDLDYIMIPSVSSERRKYIPMGFEKSEVIASNLCLIIPKATIYHFGILTSNIHMSWVNCICGRLKSDYRYSKDIVYNNFPWPENPTDKQKESVEAAAQAVLDARAMFPDASLADLYDPNTMPPVLVKAHQALDKAVDLCYRPQPFINETKRIEFLFELYDKYTSGMFAKEKKGKTIKKADP